ncbi:PREDICTED: uncharacterized protein LOC109335398 [Lupinus angustifolius]|uniref:uncharacterized protein LOC109335398 n=1 Tax=Lupinus angustifolius TaxID=3871 RepID=UPI00092F5380|nr:PREDICTED: uncharacterized protein LOC109335398 [Lupinus angustifolius]
MGRGSKYGERSKSAFSIDNENSDIITHHMKPKTFSHYVRELDQKKASVRVDALSSIIKILNEGKERDRLEKDFATSLYQILGLIKRGSAKEKELASQVLGLMAITFSTTDNAQEIYKETILVFTEVLTTKVVDPWVFINLLYSLAMVTFFCVSNAVETQEAMQLIWKFISPESNLDVPVRNHVPVIMPSAVSAWLFLFTKIEGWELSYQWKGAISIFLNMIESDDDSLCDPAAEALAMIYNSDQINKFLKVKPALSYSEIKNHIKDFILRRLENVSKAKNEISLTHVLNYFNDGISPQSLKNIDGNNLNLSSWSSMIQFKFMKKFIGEEEFFIHMMENELFHHLFDFTPNYIGHDTSCLYESTMEKTGHTIYVPEERDSELLSRKEKKEERQLRQSIIDKSKTKVLNKRRTFAEERKGLIYQVESEF